MAKLILRQSVKAHGPLVIYTSTVRKIQQARSLGGSSAEQTYRRARGRSAEWKIRVV